MNRRLGSLINRFLRRQHRKRKVRVACLQRRSAVNEKSVCGDLRIYDARAQTFALLFVSVGASGSGQGVDDGPLGLNHAHSKGGRAFRRN